MSRPAGLGIKARAQADASSMAAADADELCADVLELVRRLADMAKQPRPLSSDTRLAVLTAELRQRAAREQAEAQDAAACHALSRYARADAKAEAYREVIVLAEGLATP